MPADSLFADLNSALSNIPLIDPHSHIDPLAPVSKSLDDILGYHYYTELAHSAGMGQAVLARYRTMEANTQAVLAEDVAALRVLINDMSKRI